MVGVAIIMYAEKINTNVYLYSGVIKLTNSFEEAQENVQVKIDLDSSNFNFNLTRVDGKDIRFSEGASGDQALNYFAAEWFFDRLVATIWIGVPKLIPGEIKHIFMFFGNPSDLGNSNPNLLGFLFQYKFNTTPLDSTVWSGRITNTYNASYGYRTFHTYNAYDYFNVIAPVLENVNSYEIYIGTYYIGVTSINMWDVILSITGGENQINFFLWANKTVVNIEVYDTDKSYTQANQYVESDSYNEISVIYQESNDFCSWSLRKRNTYEDCFVTEERKVEGNTTAKSIAFREGSYAGNNAMYLRWVVVQKNTTDKITLDLTGLYKDDTIIMDSMLFSTDKYSQDLTDSGYYHESDCGGLPTHLSDEFTHDALTCWASSEATTGSVLIDFARTSVNKVSRIFKHYDSGHLPFYNASKLSDLGLDTFGRSYWEGISNSGWACIDFSPAPLIIACLSLKALDDKIEGMVKSFIFQGGYSDPRFSKSEWVDLYVGTCQKIVGWQPFYFDNGNAYRYYKLVVLSTYGINICVAEWAMYEGTPLTTSGYVINQLRLLPATFDSKEDSFPRTISFYGSNDSVTWVSLFSNITTYRPYNPGPFGFWQRYPVFNKTPYKAYKLTMSSKWVADSSNFVIAEWEMVRSYREDITYRILCDVPTTNIVYESNSNITNVWADKKTTFDSGWMYTVIDGIVMKLFDYKLSECVSTYTGAYKFRIKISINTVNITTSLVHFPIIIELDSSYNSVFDSIFDELGDSYKKIAIFNGVTQLYVEVSYWSSILRKAILWVSHPELIISSTQVAELYFYYGVDAEDNDVYVGPEGQRTEVWSENYIGVWHKASVLTQVTDSSDYQNHGLKKALTEPADTTGYLGQALLYDGFNDNVTISGSTSNATSINTGSVFAWIKTSAPGTGARGIVVKQGAYGMFLNSSVFSIYDWGNSAWRSTGVNLATNSWHFVGFTFQDINLTSPSSNATLFIDGVAVLTTTLKLLNHTSPIFFGSGGSSTQFFKGTIDEVRISNTILSSNQIYIEYLAYINGLLSYKNSDMLNDLITLN